MRFLVTGGSGFVGSYLIEKLNYMKHHVISLDCVAPNDFNPEIEIITSDLNNVDILKKIGKKIDGIFHCAGIVGSTETFSFIEKTFQTNVLGTLNLLKIAKEFNIPMINLSLKNDSMNPYMISKRTSTEICQSFYKYLNTKVCTINGLNGYGPKQLLQPTPKMVPSMINNILNNKKISINGDGKQIVDMIYITDLVEIIYLAFINKCWGKTFDAGTGVPLTVNQVAKDIIKNIGKGEIEHLPMRQGEPNRSIALADPSFIVRNLNYYPKTNWYFGLNKTIKWYKQYIKKN